MPRFPTAYLDLSLIPAPAAIKSVDYLAIKAARLADLVARFAAVGITLDTTTLESEPSVILQEADAYREMIDLEAINDAVRAVMIASATGTDQDGLFALLGIRRLVITPADNTTVPPTPAVMEDDLSFRARAQNALEATAFGLTGGGYRHVALTTAPNVRDIGIIRHPGGLIDLILLGRGPDGTVADADVALVAAAVASDDDYQLTDTVSVRSVTPLPYEIHAIATIPRGPSTSALQLASQIGLMSAAASLQQIGGTVPTDALIAGGRSTAMSKFALISPAADIIAARDQAPYCSKLTVDVYVVDSLAAADNIVTTH